MLKNILLGAVCLVLVAAVVFLLIGRERSWQLIAGSPDTGPRNFSTASRSPTANDALACSPGLCSEPDFEVAAIDETAAASIERLAQRLLASDPLARRLDDKADPTKARFVTYSWAMRFPDVIHLEARTMDDGRTGVMAYSGAQLGKKDFGKNRARLEALFGEQ